MDTPLIKEFTYDVPVNKVWLALTDPGKMRQWYFPQLKQFEPVAGFKFQFDDDHSAFQKEWIVTEVVPGKTLAHSWAYYGYPGSSEVRFELFGDESKTKLRVTQTGLQSFPDDPHFQRERFERGWDSLLGQNLKHLLHSDRS